MHLFIYFFYLTHSRLLGQKLWKKLLVFGGIEDISISFSDFLTFYLAYFFSVLPQKVFILSNYVHTIPFYTFRSHLIQKPILLMKIFSLENLNQLIWFKWPDWMSKSIRESSLFIRWVLFLKLFIHIFAQTSFEIISSLLQKLLMSFFPVSFPNFVLFYIAWLPDLSNWEFY